MAIESEFKICTIEELPVISNARKEDGSGFVQMLATNTEDGIDLTYTWLKDNLVSNYRIVGVKKGTKVPSITDNFLAAFVFENEAHDLFGVEIENIAIDFGGKFYDLTISEPMTIVSPERKAAREKAAKAAAAKAAKEKAEAEKQAAEPQAASVDVELSADKMAEIEAKVANLDPEKAEKLRTALIAKAKKELAAAQPAPAAEPEIPAEKMAEIEAKVANLDPEKAEKLRTALIARAKKDILAATKEGE